MMTRMNSVNTALPASIELTAEDREEISSLFRNETWFRPYRHVPELEPLTGLERLAEMLMVTTDNLIHPHGCR